MIICRIPIVTTPSTTTPPRPFTSARELRTYVLVHLGEHDVSVDPEYWGDEEDAVLDLMDAVLVACGTAAVRAHSAT